jgi:hypothetical protein
MAVNWDFQKALLSLAIQEAAVLQQLQLIEVLPTITSYRAFCSPMEPTRTQVMLPSSPVAGICAGQTPPVSVPQPFGSVLPLISGGVPDAV